MSPRQAGNPILDDENKKNSGANGSDSDTSPGSTASICSSANLLRPYYRGKNWFLTCRADFGSSFLFLIALVYFTQGIRSFTERAQSYFYREDLKLEPADIQIMKSITTIPWIAKTAWGLLVDNVPVFGLHAKPWLFFAAFVGIIAYAAIGTFINDLTWGLVFFFLANFSTALSDVVVDKTVVINSRNQVDGAGNLQSWTWTWLYFGGALGTGLGGYIAGALNNRAVFLILTGAPGVILIASYIMAESKSKFKFSAPQLKKQLVTAFRALIKKDVCLPIIWIFISGALPPSMRDVRTFWAREVAHIEKSWFGVVDVCGYVFLLIGTIIYSRFFKHTSFRRMFAGTQFLYAFFVMVDWFLVRGYNLAIGIPDKWFILVGDSISSIIGAIHLMPFLVLCAQLCPEGVEATFFATLMSIFNAASDVSGLSGGFMAKQLGIAAVDGKPDSIDYNNLHFGFLIRAGLALVPILIIPWMVPSTSSVDPHGILANKQNDTLQPEPNASDDIQFRSEKMGHDNPAYIKTGESFTTV